MTAPTPPADTNRPDRGLAALQRRYRLACRLRRGPWSSLSPKVLRLPVGVSVAPRAVERLRES
jgi:hypothetical protein